jgi:2'-5' RNA ligase
MESISADIVVLPSPAISAKAISVSNDLYRFGSLTLLEDGKVFPHASLYMCQLRTADLPKVEEILAAIAAKHRAISLEAAEYAQAHRFIDVGYNRTLDLDQLQEHVLDAINPVRHGLRPQDEARLKTSTGRELENLKKYGYRGIGDEFRPHITITRFEREQKFDTSDLPAISEFSGSFTHLGLFEMGPNGTCVRQIATFALQI